MLPPQARVTLANAIDNWVPQPVLACYHRTRDIIATVQMVRFYDYDEPHQRAADRRKGRGPYRGNAPEIS